MIRKDTFSIAWMQGAMVFLYLLFSFSGSQCLAMEKIYFGQIEVNPMFYVTQTYNDNIDVGSDESSGDWITALSSQLQLKWPIRQHFLQADWSFTKPNYTKYYQKDYKEYRLSTAAEFFLGKGGEQFVLDINQFYLRSANTPEELAEPPRKRTENRLNSTFKMNILDNMRLDLGYKSIVHQYEDSLDDRDVNEYEAIMNFQISEKTFAFISVQQGQVNSGNFHHDSDFWSVIPGFHLDRTAKLSGAFSTGLEKKDYKNRKDANIWIIIADLTYRISDATKVALGFNQKEREYSITIHDADDRPKGCFNNYILDRVQLSFNHQLTYKMGAEADVAYEYDDYKRIFRHDHVYLLGLNLKYQIQKTLGTSLVLQHKYKNSTGDPEYTDNNYSNNIISFSLNLRL